MFTLQIFAVSHGSSCESDMDMDPVCPLVWDICCSTSYSTVSFKSNNNTREYLQFVFPTSVSIEWICFSMSNQASEVTRVSLFPVDITWWPYLQFLRLELRLNSV